jgi:hypothetical protein
MSPLEELVSFFSSVAPRGQRTTKRHLRWQPIWRSQSTEDWGDAGLERGTCAATEPL